ncbi:MAG: hypothetical protein PHZ22_05550, partial [Bacteroidales bacterium]|nr:hypothetical protein [Bacteroidales bacterium]
MTITTAKVEKFMNLVSGAGRVLLVGHTNPDGDSIGSLTGTKAFLRSAFPKIVTTAVVPTDYPDFLKFVDARGEILNFLSVPSRVRMEVKKANVI